MIRFFYYAVPVVVLVLFVAVMQSGLYLKLPTGEDDDVPRYIQKIAADVGADDWDAARQDVEKLDKAHRILTKRIQFSVERDDIQGLGLSIARAKGMIEARDKAGTLSQMYEAYAYWNDFGK
ncbi:hypothetical protein [Anaeroselena agilis]|uniref:Uncharacterized protein n=1 Tax=Anaeroselena agilis TaxID=3063788 RepID=A0ABU3NV62_9FIRM|nr:hypothetical protein [Selenomonadales bacterium 4137-cl]